MAVDAAGSEAERRGYQHAMIVARQFEGEADDIGRHLATLTMRMRTQPGPDCLITGGEPVVTLIDSAQRGLGGRNQQLVLAALDELIHNRPPASEEPPCQGITILSGGTDGEDGPTDAAGAWINESVGAPRGPAGTRPATTCAATTPTASSNRSTRSSTPDRHTPTSATCASCWSRVSQVLLAEGDALGNHPKSWRTGTHARPAGIAPPGDGPNKTCNPPGALLSPTTTALPASPPTKSGCELAAQPHPRRSTDTGTAAPYAAAG